MAELEVKQLVCGYGKEDIVKGISFTLGDGEILSVAGSNGCGKTTLLRGICGLLPVRSGGAYLGVPDGRGRRLFRVYRYGNGDNGSLCAAEGRFSRRNNS